MTTEAVVLLLVLTLVVQSFLFDLHATWSPDDTGPPSRRTRRVVDANARVGGRCRPAQRAREDGDAAMMGMIAAAAVLLGLAVLTFWLDVENMRARHAAHRFDRTYERNRARAGRR